MGPGPWMWVLVGASNRECDHPPATRELWGAQSRATRGHAQLARAKVNFFFSLEAKQRSSICGRLCPSREWL